MFHKIAIADNRIKVIKWIVKKTEQFHTIDENGQPVEKTDEWEEWSWAVESPGTNALAVNVPQDILQYDNMLWDKGRDEAVLLVNGKSVRYYEEMLNKTDYKSIRDCSKYLLNQMTPEEKAAFEISEAERQLWRDKINILRNGG
jgi:hypothetical protein